MRLPLRPHPVLIWSSWIVVALFLQYGPPNLKAALQTQLIEWTNRSLVTINAARASISEIQMASSSMRSEDRSAVTQDASRALQAQIRDLKLHLAVLQDENQRLHRIPEIPVAHSTAPRNEIVAAPVRVSGVRRPTDFTGQRILIAQGASQGIGDQQLVVEGTGVVVDLGADGALQADQMVTFGRTLFGRVAQVGTSSSLVQTITDPEFRIATQLFRVNEIGVVPGPQGVLAGTGTGCSLLEVRATEPVAVGDYVYTNPMVAPTGVPVFCGRVVRAELGDSDLHWTIDVEPVHSITSIPRELRVLKTQPARNASEPQDTLEHGPRS